MRASRRSFLKTTALGAGAAVAAPYMFVRNIDQAWGAQSWIKKGEPIKIGLLFSLSGGLAVPEEDSTLVMQYAIDEINKAGGVAGMPIEPVIVDAKSDFNVYSEKTKELILRNKVVSIFGCYTSASRKAILPTVMAQDHLLYYPTCYEGAECTQNTICTGPLANQHSKDLIPYMVEQFGKKVFFVGSNYVWPKESNKNAKIWLQKAGGELLGEEYIPLGGSEFGPVLNKIRDAKPNFIFSTVVGASDIAFHKQFKQEGFKVGHHADRLADHRRDRNPRHGQRVRRRPLPFSTLLPGIGQSDQPQVRRGIPQEQIRQERNDALQHGGDLYLRLRIQVRPRKSDQGGRPRRRDAARDPRPFRRYAGRRRCLARRPDLDRRSELQHLAEAQDRTVPGRRQLQDRQGFRTARRARSVFHLSRPRQSARRPVSKRRTARRARASSEATGSPVSKA